MEGVADLGSFADMAFGGISGGRVSKRRQPEGHCVPWTPFTAPSLWSALPFSERFSAPRTTVPGVSCH